MRENIEKMLKTFNRLGRFHVVVGRQLFGSVFLMFLQIVLVLGLKCVCDRSECDVIRQQDCPGKGFIVWDPCK